MTDTDRIDLFRQAVLMIENLEAGCPSYPPFESIHNQLSFLIGQVSGQVADRDGLARINLGEIAVHEVEPVDSTAADIFYLVATEAATMLNKTAP